MKKWIARKLFDLAVWLDWDEAVKSAVAVMLVETLINRPFEQESPKKKRGRPVGSKNRPKAVKP